MSMMSEVLEQYKVLEAEAVKQKEDQTQRRILLSKIKSVNDHIAALLQKKIRIDLEIRHSKKKLSQLKSQVQTLVKTRVELEGINYESLNQKDCENFNGKSGKRSFRRIAQIRRARPQS